MLLNILHIDTGRELRGGQWQILELTEALRKRGHRQAVATPHGSALERRACAAGLYVFPLTSVSAWNLRGSFRLRQFIRRQSFDIIHAHDAAGQNVAWTASMGLPVRRVASRRVAFLSSRTVHRLKYNFTCHGVIAISRCVRNLLVESGVRQHKISVIYDGVPVPATLATVAERKAIRARWQADDGSFVIGHLGAFTSEKGQEIAIEALRIIASRFPGAMLLLAGEGPARAAMERACETHGASNVHFLGYLDGWREFFSALDLFVMPSRSEGLGSAALLAMAYGLPVIASRAGGLPEIVDEGKTGWLVQPSSAAALAQAIAEAISDTERLGAMRRAAREKALRFTSDILAARTEELYCRLLAAGRQASETGTRKSKLAN